VLDGRIVGEGEDISRTSGDPTDHAELRAIRAAITTIGPSALADCTLFASCEPCMMCTAAILRTRVSVTYYAARREQAEAYGYRDVVPADELRELRTHQTTLELVGIDAVGSDRPFKLSPK